jgi:itaconate CoA-transferase
LELQIEEIFQTLPIAEVEARLERAQIATGRLNDMAALYAHPQLAARRRWTETDSSAGSIPVLLPPQNLAAVPPRMGRVPTLGEHTAEVLAELDERTKPE